MTILIEKTTAAANSERISIARTRPGKSPRHEKNSTIRIIGNDLGADEYVKLQYYDGSTWKDAKINGNDSIILDEDNNVCTIYGRMVDMRVSKSETASATGVEIV
jgi:hypothetical protein